MSKSEVIWTWAMCAVHSLDDDDDYMWKNHGYQVTWMPGVRQGHWNISSFYTNLKGCHIWREHIFFLINGNKNAHIQICERGWRVLGASGFVGKIFMVIDFILKMAEKTINLRQPITWHIPHNESLRNKTLKSHPKMASNLKIQLKDLNLMRIHIVTV